MLVSREDMERVTQQTGNSNGPAAVPRRRRVVPAGDTVAEITEDMRRVDLVEVLQHLRLPREESTCLLRLDRACRDYLVTALRSR
jgi:hypothetical protein